MLILNKPTSTYLQCKKWAESKNPNPLFLEILPKLYNIAIENGIDPTLVIVQCAKETGYCKFGGVLDASFRNPCGLKIAQGGDNYDPNAHKRFDSWDDGITAQCQHLALYAGKEGYPLSNPLDPRHFSYLLGKCPTVESLSGNWAGKTYGQDLVVMMAQIINTDVDELYELESMIEELKSIIEEKDKTIKDLQDKLYRIKEILE